MEPLYLGTHLGASSDRCLAGTNVTCVNWDQVIGAVSMVAGLAAAYFGYVAVRGRIRRRSIDTPGIRPSGEPFDAFISYAEADEERAEWLAAGLHHRGLRIFLAKWIGVGLVEYAEKERALANTVNGILLFSSSTMNVPEIRDEYAALLQRVHSGGRRFIPVIVEDVDLPPLARIRKALDLTDSRNSDAEIDKLAELLREPSA